VAKEHPLSPLLWLEERMLDCNTGEKRGYCNTGRITAGELVSGGGREKGDCDGAKNPTRGGILVSSLFMKREQMVTPPPPPPRKRFRFFLFLSVMSFLSLFFLIFLYVVYTDICIYSARVPSFARNQISIKLILFFFLKFKLESNSKADNYHYLEGKDYL